MSSSVSAVQPRLYDSALVTLIPLSGAVGNDFRGHRLRGHRLWTLAWSPPPWALREYMSRVVLNRSVVAPSMWETPFSAHFRRSTPHERAPTTSRNLTLRPDDHAESGDAARRLGPLFRKSVPGRNRNRGVPCYRGYKYDCAMVTQITLNTEPHGFDSCRGHYGKSSALLPVPIWAMINT